MQKAVYLPFTQQQPATGVSSYLCREMQKAVYFQEMRRSGCRKREFSLPTLSQGQACIALRIHVCVIYMILSRCRRKPLLPMTKGSHRGENKKNPETQKVTVKWEIESPRTQKGTHKKNQEIAELPSSIPPFVCSFKFLLIPFNLIFIRTTSEHKHKRSHCH